MGKVGGCAKRTVGKKKKRFGRKRMVDDCGRQRPFFCLRILFFFRLFVLSEPFCTVYLDTDRCIFYGYLKILKCATAFFVYKQTNKQANKHANKPKRKQCCLSRVALLLPTKRPATNTFLRVIIF